MLTRIHHFGVTVRRPLETLRFYNGLLNFPFVSLNAVMGKEYEELYKLERPVNFIAWYQFPKSALELFYLPFHPPRSAAAGDILIPGYRYAGYSVEGLDEYMSRFDAGGVEYRLAECEGERALKLRDPSGINVVLFETKSGGRSGRTLGIEEVGLTVADPDAYEEYFEAIGLAASRGPDSALIESVFAFDQPVIMKRYGHIRLLHFPEGAPRAGGKFFPQGGGEGAHGFNETGVRHAAYAVDDAAAFYEKARTRGVHFLFAPKVVLGGSIISYFLDPEGNTIEVIQQSDSAVRSARILGEIKLAEMTVRAHLRRIPGLR
ncbi:MAG TPA: VOC family protein [bacterium]|nr:VOC family protein [bacterium]